MKKAAFPLLILYLCIFLGITIFNRLPFDEVHYNLKLFWSYREAVTSRKLVWEIVLNYFLLLPYGILAPLYMRKRWALLTGFLLSAMVEFTQYFMRRGLLEFDDIIGNTLGIVIGIGISQLVTRRGEV